MRELPQPLDRLLGRPAYLPRVTTHDGRAIEQALMGATLTDPGVSLPGAVVEASYAAGDPELLRRVRATHVPFVVELQSMRFTSGRFLEIERIGSLPFAPSSPIEPATFGSREAWSLSHGAMTFEQDVGASAYTTAGLPLPNGDATLWLDANRRIIEAACAANGAGELERRPVIAQIIPGRCAIARPESVLSWLVDLPVAAVYVQPLNLHPVKDSAEKLGAYVDFLLACLEAGLPVMVGRVGAFGLVLQALGVSAFDSGLGDAETFALSSLLRERAPSQSNKSAGGRDRRVYFDHLKTTLQAKHVEAILSDRGLRARFVCGLGCCQHGGFEDLPQRRRQHYLWTRNSEVGRIAALPPELRVDHVHDELSSAREHARVVRRTLVDRGVPVPNFDHLDRWLGLLARHADEGPRITRALPAVPPDG